MNSLVLEQWVLISDLVNPITNETFQAFHSSSARMGSQETPEERQQTDRNDGCQDEAPNHANTIGACPRWEQTPMGRWEMEKVEEQPWNALAVLNISSHWRESLGARDTCSTKGETGSVGGNTR